MGTGSLAPALIFGAISLGSVACSDGGSSKSDGGAGGTLVATGGTGGSGGTAGQAGSGGSGGAGARDACPDGPGMPGAPRQQQVSRVRAQLVDLEDAPAVESPQVCGIDVCVFIDDADSSGSISRIVNQSFDRPAFKNGLGVRFAKFAFALPAGGEYELGAFRTVRLPEAGAPLVAGAAAQSGPATLSLAADAEFEIDVLTFSTPADRLFRAAAVPIDRAPPAVDPTLGFEILVATTPVDTVICPAARLSVGNSAAWPAGTAVEFFVHGVSIEEHWAPYGGWAKVSDGAVSADGASVVTAERGGIPVLGVIGIRRAP